MRGKRGHSAVKKAMDIVRTILVWMVVLAAVAMTVFTFFSLTTLNRNDRAIFGYKIFIVNTDSMEKTDFKAGDLIFVKNIEPEELKIGDIITFISKDENSLYETLTHKIRCFTTDSFGNKGFITYGTSTNTDDEGIVLYEDVLGKYEFHIAGLGTIFNFLKTTQGFFLCIFTPIMLVIVYELINFFVLLRQSKQEELDAVEEERLANEKLVKELLVLKCQLEGRAVGPVVPREDQQSVKVKVRKVERHAGKTSKVVVKSIGNQSSKTH